MKVLVTGMHRSGTSAVAGSLQAAGLGSGDGTRLIPAHDQNPAGFWEREDILEFNDRLLASLGWAWDTPPAIPPSAVPDRPAFVDEGRELVASTMAGSGSVYIKDPRLSLLLPWWRRILLDRFVTIVVMRRREEVAWSLSVRDGFPAPLGHALSSAYLRHLTVGLTGLPAIVVDYPSLVEDPQATIPRMLGELERLGINGPMDAAAAIGSIQPLLRRATQPDATAVSGPSEETWVADSISTIERFDQQVAPAEPWEIALLDLHRTARAANQRAAEAGELLSAATSDAALSVAGANAAREAFAAVSRDAATAQADAAAGRAQASEARAEAQAAQAVAEAAREEARAAREEALAAREEALGAQSALALASEEAEAAREEARAARSALALASEEAEAARAGSNHGSFWYRHDRLARWVRRPMRGLWLLVTFRLWREMRTNRLFDSEWYLARYPDVRADGMDPREHFWARGAQEGRNPNSLFDTAWYLEQNPDVAAGGMNPLDHYLYFGGAEGRDPSPRFDTDWYLGQHPDVRKSAMNPLLHYLTYGEREKRPARQPEQPTAGHAETSHVGQADAAASSTDREPASP